MPRALVSDRLVTVFGGSGFVGRHVVGALAKSGWQVRNACRRPDLAGHLQPLGSVGQVVSVQANVRHEGSVRAACDGADAVVNLVSILHQTGRQTFAEVNAAGARRVAEAAKAAGARSLVHVSAIAGDLHSKSAYARSKAEGAAAALEAFPRAVVLRPSVVFGPEDHFFNLFAGLARFTPVLPLIGGGHTRFQPVFAGDVGDAVVAALEGKAKPGAAYELGGPEIKTFREILEYILHVTGRRRLLVPLPFFAARMKAAILQLLPSPLLTVDQVTMLESDSVVSAEAMKKGLVLEGLGVRPTAIETVVPAYLYRFRKAGQFTDVTLTP